MEMVKSRSFASHYSSYEDILYPGSCNSSKSHLKTLSNELSDFAILRILLPSDDEVNEAGSVPEDGSCVCLGHPHKAGRVHLEANGEGVAGGIDADDGDGTDSCDSRAI